MTDYELTPDWVRAQVAAIQAISDDDEVAHSLEDSLHGEVLQAIADGKCADHAACATEALKTENIRFSRWCA